MAAIAILVTGEPSDTIARSSGGYADMVRRAAGFHPEVTMHAFDGRRDDLPAPENFDGIVITGSDHSVYERLPWMIGLEGYLRTAITEECHVLGLCFGHQLLASAFGGQVVRNPRGRETGKVLATPVAPDEVLGLPREPFPVLMVHQDTVQRLPRGSVVLAHTNRDAHAAIRFGPRCWGVQFHPEFSPEVLGAFIDEQHEALLAQGDDPGALRAELADTPAATGLLQAFVRQVAAAR